MIVRTADQISQVVSANPFLDRSDDPTHHHVVFLDDEGPIAAVDAEKFAPEDLRAVGRQVYMFCPGGVGRSKLAVAVSKRNGPTGTMRNWRSVTNLDRMLNETAAME